MRYRHRRSLPFASCSLAVLLSSAAAFGQSVTPLDATPAQKKDAMEHFTLGKHAFASKDWDQAIAELRSSLGIVDSPNARLELARALRHSGHPGDAWMEYGRVIEKATQLAAKEERYAKTADAATSEREELEAKLALVTVSVANAPAGATLQVRGRSVSQAQWNNPVVATTGAVDVILVDSG